MNTPALPLASSAPSCGRRGDRRPLHPGAGGGARTRGGCAGLKSYPSWGRGKVCADPPPFPAHPCNPHTDVSVFRQVRGGTAVADCRCDVCASPTRKVACPADMPISTGVPRRASRPGRRRRDQSAGRRRRRASASPVVRHAAGQRAHGGRGDPIAHATRRHGGAFRGEPLDVSEL